MAKVAQNVVLSPSRDIPFNKLVLSQSNVRRVKAGVSVEELAEDIARRGLLQSLNVRPVLDEDGVDQDVGQALGQRLPRGVHMAGEPLDGHGGECRCR